eukprot:jgi/Tetstr1/465085/TSEL_009813.t1
MSDGGPDHNVSFYTVIAAWLALFMELEMDVLTISRTAPTQSYMNRDERCMSELNRGLQNNALARVRVDDNFEKAFAKRNSMTAIRAAAAKALNEELQAEADDEPMPPLAEESDSDEEEAGDSSSSSEGGTDISSSETGSDMSVTAEEDQVVESLAALKAGPAAAAT